MDSWLYKVELAKDTIEDGFANTNAANLFSQVERKFQTTAKMTMLW